jgi:hypothetical protein
MSSTQEAQLAFDRGFTRPDRLKNPTQPGLSRPSGSVELPLSARQKWQEASQLRYYLGVEAVGLHHDVTRAMIIEECRMGWAAKAALWRLALWRSLPRGNTGPSHDLVISKLSELDSLQSATNLLVSGE